MGLKEFFLALPSIDQVPVSTFYITGYTEALRLFSDVRVVLGSDWLQGVPGDLQDYFYSVGFPCYFIPIFSGGNCFGFVTKGYGKRTPRFATNMLLPGCERVKGGETVVFVEGLKDAFLPIMACKGLQMVIVVPLLTALPGKELLQMLARMGCSAVLVPDNDEHTGNHLARFYELCGKCGIKGSSFRLSQVKDFGDFFNPEFRTVSLSEAKRLREFLVRVKA